MSTPEPPPPPSPRQPISPPPAERGQLRELSNGRLLRVLRGLGNFDGLMFEDSCPHRLHLTCFARLRVGWGPTCVVRHAGRPYQSSGSKERRPGSAATGLW